VFTHTAHDIVRHRTVLYDVVCSVNTAIVMSSTWS